MMQIMQTLGDKNFKDLIHHVERRVERAEDKLMREVDDLRMRNQKQMRILIELDMTVKKLEREAAALRREIGARR